MNTIIRFLAVFFVLFFVLFSCKKDEPISKADPIESEFCTHLGIEDFNSIQPIINQYLKGQNHQLAGEERLNQLNHWLMSKSCVDSSKVRCVSCIYTNPPQSELRLWYNANGAHTSKIIDILMADTLRMVGYHD
jgi:hypothetical protein